MSKHINHQSISAYRLGTVFRYLSLSIIAVLVIILSGILMYLVRFEQSFKGKIYPYVFIDDVPFGGQTPRQAEDFWLNKNSSYMNARFEFADSNNHIATVAGSLLDIGYDATLSATQAYLIGRSGNLPTDFLAKFNREPVQIKPFFRYKTDVIDEILTNLSMDIDVQPQDGLFTFENGRVTAFKPSSQGRRLDRDATKEMFSARLDDMNGEATSSVSIPLVIETLDPAIATDQVNSLGIKEQIGRGHSVFPGSIAGRIHNVALAASRFNGVLIAPGETLSFNKTLGDVSAATGYQSAYIIKNGRTVLGDGGGVCQVSTTLFRAALDAGLPVEERHAHAYRVHYYEDGGYKPGLDATVFDPSADFKITNDTGHHILVQTQTDLNTLELVFTLYGTSDGRTASTYDYKMWDVSPPPQPLYQDDPTLRKDVVKQVDWAAWGAKASFKYKVTRGDETLQDTTFLSVYRPWQAVYLKGTME